MKIWAKTEKFKEGKYLVVRRDGTVPAWPHFVLGARDPAAPIALVAYAKECERLGFDPEYVQSLLELAGDFTDYQLKEGEGDPESGPHRTDDPAVIMAMRGFGQIILARPEHDNKNSGTRVCKDPAK